MPNDMTLIKDENYILKKIYVNKDNDIVWEIKEPSSQNIFLVYTSKKGHLYITFYKDMYISRKCSIKAIKKICKILLEENLIPTINIHYKNTTLIDTCRKAGFKKVPHVPHLYCFKKIN